MAGGGRENLEGAEDLGKDDKDTGTGGRQPTGLGDVFQGGGAGGTPIRVGDVGDDTPHGQGPGDFSSQSLQADYRETAKAMGGWDLGVPTSGDSNAGGGV